MVPVQKDEWLLAQYDEYGVAQFWYFRQHEHGRPEAWHFVLNDETVAHKIHRIDVNQSF